jgi:SAM-dependent methyltransferase
MELSSEAPPLRRPSLVRDSRRSDWATIREVGCAWDEDALNRYRELTEGLDAAYEALSAVVIATIQRSGFASSSTVLDAGCGVGWLSYGLSSQGYRVTGIDVSPRSIEYASRLSRGSTRGAIADPNFVTGDMGDLADDPTTRFDIVVLNMVLHNCPDVRSAIAGCIRSLRPGGLIVATITDPLAYLVKHNASDHPYEQPSCFRLPLKLHGAPIHRTTVPYFHRPLSFYLSEACVGVRLRPAGGTAVTVGPGRSHDTWVLVARL